MIYEKERKEKVRRAWATQQVWGVWTVVTQTWQKERETLQQAEWRLDH